MVPTNIRLRARFRPVSLHGCATAEKQIVEMEPKNSFLHLITKHILNLFSRGDLQDFCLQNDGVSVRMKEG